NSRFRNCDVFDLEITEYNGSGPPTNFTIENNWFATSGSGGYYSLEFNSNASEFDNILVRNNSSTQEMLFDNGPPLNNVHVAGNIAPLVPWNCASPSVYSHNVWQGATCGTTDINAAPGFVNAAGFDLHLANGSAAINRGDPSNYPATDIDGDARPMGGAP